MATRYDRKNAELFREVLKKREAQSEIHREATRLRRRVAQVKNKEVSSADFGDWLSVLSRIEDITKPQAEPLERRPHDESIPPPTVSSARQQDHLLLAEKKKKKTHAFSDACCAFGGPQGCHNGDSSDVVSVVAYSTEPTEGVTRYSCHVDTPATCRIS
mmetsp:Transcript_19832/g.63812  ORF Transcript_19832/g.63812 Transcript_19832/m.63812 type:complete len:159 (+) Transcript_19832:82-558(+)